MSGKDFWLDDPEWELLRRKAENRPISKELKQQTRPTPKLRAAREEPRLRARKEVAEKEVTVNLKFTLPKVGVPDFRHFYRTHQRQVIKAAVVVVVFAGVLTTYNVLSASRKTKEANKPTTPQQQAQTAFNPLVPLENLTDATGKQAKPEFKYDPEKKVLGYATEYNNANLTISQQAVPKDFSSNPAKLLSAASSIKANAPLETQKGTAYIGTDNRTGAQTAVFVTKEVLVFVRSDKRLDDDEWKFYINQLNPSK